MTISPDAVTVLSPSGESLPVESTSFDETIDRNSSTFTGAVRFTVEDSGVHRVSVEGVGPQVIVAPSIASSFGNALAWLAVVALGALLAVIGLVLLIVGLVRGTASGCRPCTREHTRIPRATTCSCAPRGRPADGSGRPPRRGGTPTPGARRGCGGGTVSSGPTTCPDCVVLTRCSVPDYVS